MPSTLPARSDPSPPVVVLRKGPADLRPWSAIRARIGTATIPGPSSELMGCKLEEADSEPNTHDIRTYVKSTTPSRVVAVTFLGKAAERRHARVWLGTGRQEGPAGRADVTFDLATGRLSHRSNVGEGVAILEAKSVSLRSGWFEYRLLCRFDRAPEEVLALISTALDGGNLPPGVEGAGFWIADLVLDLSPSIAGPERDAREDHRPLLDRIDEEILTYLKEEIAAKGSIYWWYEEFAKSGRGLSPMDRAIIGFWLRRFGKSRRMVDIGAGLGQTSLALSLHGVPAVAVEIDRKNFDLMERLRARLALKFDLDLLDRHRLLLGLYPRDTVPVIGRDTVLVVQGLAATMTAEEEAKLIPALAPADGLIFTERLFFKRRDTAEERSELIARIRALGFGEPEVVVDLSDAKNAYAIWRILYMRNERPRGS